MNQVQQLIRKTISGIQAIPKDQHRPKWRNTVLKKLEEIELLAAAVPNPDHPMNQPLPPEPYRSKEQDESVS